MPSTQAQRCRNETARRSSKKAPEEPTWMHEVNSDGGFGFARLAERTCTERRASGKGGVARARSGPRSLAPRGEGRVMAA